MELRSVRNVFLRFVFSRYKKRSILSYSNHYIGQIILVYTSCQHVGYGARGRDKMYVSRDVITYWH